MHEIFRHSTFTSTTIPHTTTENTTLNGFQIPKGILIFVNQYAANHDPNIWENPDDFIPERFLDSNGELVNKPHDQYFLFSHGSRKCPGDEISRLLILHLMVNLLTLSTFESDPSNPVTLDGVYNLSMRPKVLRTRIKIRRPALLDILTQNLDKYSPCIETVDSQNSSFVSSSSLKQEDHDNQSRETSNSIPNLEMNRYSETTPKISSFQAGIGSPPTSQPARK